MLAVRGLVGARIGLWHRNSIAAIEATLAVEWLGGTRVPVDPNAAPAEADAIWEAAGVAAIVTDAERANHLSRDAVVHDDYSSPAAAPMPPIGNVDPERVCILYPRAMQDNGLLAVPISYANWEATMTVNIALYEHGGYGPPVAADDCFLTVQQIMHGTGLVGTFPFLRMGLPQIVMAEFDVDCVIELCESGAVTSTMMVSAMVSRLADALDGERRPLRGLRRLLYGGAPLARPQFLTAVSALPNMLVQLFGTLEGGWPLTVLSPSDHDSIANGDAVQTGSCGRPVPIVGELTVDPSGRIRVRSAMVVREHADQEGWCTLSDLGRLDQGYLHLTGRADRMINTGYHIFPQEIENIIRSVPGIADVLVRGERDERRGQMVVAYLTAVAETTNAELIKAVERHLRDRLAAYKIPRLYHLVSRLP